MEAREHQGKTLRYIAIEPDGYDPNRHYPMILLLHGFGANMADLANLCPAIDPKGYVYICPNAPLEAQIGFGVTGYAWTPRGSRDPQDIQRAEDMLSTLVEEVMAQYGVPAGDVALGGFSQGGMMTYRLGLPNPDIFGGLIVLSGRVNGPDSLRERLPASRTQAIFVAHGTTDAMIPVQDARDSLEFLALEGYKPHYKEYRMGHQISQEVLDDLVPWLANVLPPIS